MADDNKTRLMFGNTGKLPVQPKVPEIKRTNTDIDPPRFVRLKEPMVEPADSDKITEDTFVDPPRFGNRRDTNDEPSNNEPEDDTGMTENRTMLGGPPVIEEPEIEPILDLDRIKVPEYEQMLRNLFRSHGPTACHVSLDIEGTGSTTISAAIEQNWTRAMFKMSNELSFGDLQEIITYLKERGITDPIREMLYALGCHEIGHWEFPSGKGIGCPFDRPNYYARIYGPIFDVFKTSGKFDEKAGEFWANREANAVADIIDNWNVTYQLERIGKTYDGMKLFWYLQGLKAVSMQKHDRKTNGTISLEYALFVQMHLNIIGDEDGHDKKLLAKFMPRDPRLERAANHLTGIFNNDIDVNRETWETFARKYAKQVIDFIDPKATPPQQNFSPRGFGNGQPQNGDQQQNGQQKQNGNGQGNDENNDSGQQKGNGQQQNGSGKGRGNKDKEGKEQGGTTGGKDGGQAKNKDPKNKKDKSGKPGDELTPDEIKRVMEIRKQKGNEQVPGYIDLIKARRAHYELRAQGIKIDVDQGALPNASYPAIPIVSRPFDPYRDDVFRIVPGRFIHDPMTGQMRPAIPAINLPLQIPIRDEEHGLPDCLFILLDSSGSMMDLLGHNYMMPKYEHVLLPWGEGSKYDYGLRTFFAHLQFFRSRNILDKVRISAGIFSDATFTAEGLDASIERMLNPVTGGTRIDIDKVIERLAQSSMAERPVIFPLISDGEIDNWSSIGERLIKMVKDQGHWFYMIQIGSDSKASREIRDAGLPVHLVTSAEDIVQLSVNLTARGYQEAMAKRNARIIGGMGY